MTHDPQHASIFSIDVTAEPEVENKGKGEGATIEALLRRMVDAQERQNELLEDLTQQMNASQRQRANELVQWREANPHLARGCRRAAESLSRVQTQFLESLTDEIIDNEECLGDGDFMLNEFVDRFGPRLAHLNGVLQVLSQLSTASTPSSA